MIQTIHMGTFQTPLLQPRSGVRAQPHNYHTVSINSLWPKYSCYQFKVLYTRISFAVENWGDAGQYHNTLMFSTPTTLNLFLQLLFKFPSCWSSQFVVVVVVGGGGGGSVKLQDRVSRGGKCLPDTEELLSTLSSPATVLEGGCLGSNCGQALLALPSLLATACTSTEDILAAQAQGGASPKKLTAIGWDPLKSTQPGLRNAVQ